MLCHAPPCISSFSLNLRRVAFFLMFLVFNFLTRWVKNESFPSLLAFARPSWTFISCWTRQDGCNKFEMCVRLLSINVMADHIMHLISGETKSFGPIVQVSLFFVIILYWTIKQNTTDKVASASVFSVTPQCSDLVICRRLNFHHQ